MPAMLRRSSGQPLPQASTDRRFSGFCRWHTACSDFSRKMSRRPAGPLTSWLGNRMNVMQRIVFVIDWLRTTTASVRAGRWRLLTHDKKLTISALLPMLTFASGSTLATEWHAISDIVSTTQKAVVATQPVGSDFDVQVQTPDPRLRLSACQQPLQARPTGSPGQLGAHVTVLVQCHDKKPWKIYVRATIGLYQPV